MTLHKKVVAILLAISFIPLILLGTISFNYLKNALELETIEQCSNITKQIHLEIDEYLNKTFVALKMAAANPSIKAFDLTASKEFLVEAAKHNPNSFSLDDTKGNQVVRGDNIKLANIWERPFYQDALNGKEEAISGVVFSKNSQRLVVNLMTPIRDANNKVIGVMQGSLPLTQTSEIVSSLSNDTKLAYVVDSEGKILAHPDQELVKSQADFSTLPFIKTALETKQSGSTIIENENGQQLVSYIFDNRTGWIICTETPYSVITDKSNALFWTIVSIMAVIFILVIFIAYYIANKFTKPILEMQYAAEQIANGNLKNKLAVSSDDEFGKLSNSFNSMIDSLQKLVDNVQHNSARLSDSARQLLHGTEQSSTAANQIALSINSVAENSDKQYDLVTNSTNIVNKMSEHINNVAAKTEESARYSQDAVEIALQGSKEVQNFIKKMNDIETTVSQSAKSVSELGERSKEIGQIIDTISGIASQTNLLALNAAIEAARAGEQGKGFAVVAEEVRKLAEQSQEAATRIAKMINEMQTGTKEAVDAMNIGTEEVSSGVAAITETGKNFDNIMNMIAKLSEEVANISGLINNLSGNIQNVVAAMEQIDEFTKKSNDEAQTVSAATQEQTASIEEIQESSNHLNDMATELQKAIQEFKL